MPTIMTHAAVPLALWCASERRRIWPRLLAAGVVAAMVPDADVLAFALHIPYADAFGHRGASHLLLFAALMALFGAAAHRLLRADAVQAAVLLCVCTASHRLLDAMTSGSLGVALGWPWSGTRWFAPWRPIRVSPFATGFFNAHGLTTLLSELRWVWLPLTVAVLGWKCIQRAAPQDRVS
ncbi:membrane protein [Xanthomonas oryzae pv. oryzicola]|uniref:Inner membrane protein YbcI n=1 Tax=Xanthomonas oryzae pv. oryzicola (strain BLS256) TaxID=383407 RepID=G7TD88_XANOB|nr:metal-dependent hydrolase [Xanthomonas oryzae]AEQ95034.1 inner membrane protein YbcI [Xanthomonas oryzae pv. oryzicola BLS256]AKN92289.1 membrane protein [Xanthomonas oryzae pv. oryzicola]AKN96025.1 membrane protein [Xanthomonas oryzae pv. oryzicola]AKO11246.1 membrane protein [Xanthomonas oryzae pv. oryzicola]AKO14985.1 membrane protein [Xanthomonas oryzae pv. oryzicola]